MTDVGLGSWPRRRARILPHSVAFRQDARTWTYGQLADRVERLAGGLAERGVRKGDRVAYLGPNDIATFETFFAVLRLGAIFVPLNTRLSVAELAYMLDDSGSRTLVYAAQTADLAAGAAAHADTPPALIACEGAPRVRSADHYEAVLSPIGTELLSADVALDDPALILYTSGTTGRPKGAVLSHANLTFNVMNQLAHTDVLGTDVVLCMAPLFHVTGLNLVSIPTFFKGGTLVIAPKFDPASALATIARERVVGFAAVPTMLQMLADHPAWDTADTSSMRYVVFGGSPIQARVADAWHKRGISMLHGYGMTEASPGIFMSTPESARERPLAAGVAHFYVDIALATGAGTPARPPGHGELLVQGPNVFQGYWGRPQETAAGFDHEWFRTGDVVDVADDGWARIVDRVKDMYISGGENVYPAEVEAVIAQFPGVADSAVVGVPDDRWGEVGAAFVMCAENHDLDRAGLLRHLEDRLARYKVPRYLSVVDDLPRTASGKVRKAQLRVSPATGDSRPNPEDTP
ncbi:acyl-CoA synthetase [Yinghuangia sp. YIM S09857]|uniref:acyl-CoA synthetase n=1 Tax=Yinghuangia sp. YIM S09857 TaxID=3436929 RepID=UPI003F530B21